VERINTALDKAIELGMEYLPKLGLAIIVLIVGFWIIKRLKRLLRIWMEKAGLGQDIMPFLLSITNMSLKVLLIFSVAEIVGIETASFIAVLAATGFAVGLALQGNLGNFASGVIILLFKPYKVGDIVEIDDNFGTVEEIQIFNTIIESPGKKIRIIPNRKITDDVVVNFSKKGVLRLELEVSIAYENNYEDVLAILKDILKANPMVLDGESASIGIKEYESHTIRVILMPYINPNDFWEARFSIYQEIKKEFARNNIKVGYPEGIDYGSFE
jgi:small conductance mechanosensitive channel